jgi:hypothetical protein
MCNTSRHWTPAFRTSRGNVQSTGQVHLQSHAAIAKYLRLNASSVPINHTPELNKQWHSFTGARTGELIQIIGNSRLPQQTEDLRQHFLSVTETEDGPPRRRAVYQAQEPPP